MSYGEWLKLTGLTHTPDVFIMWIVAMNAQIASNRITKT